MMYIFSYLTLLYSREIYGIFKLNKSQFIKSGLFLQYYESIKSIEFSKTYKFCKKYFLYHLYLVNKFFFKKKKKNEFNKTSEFSKSNNYSGSIKITKSDDIILSIEFRISSIFSQVYDSFEIESSQPSSNLITSSPSYYLTYIKIKNFKE